MTGASPRVSAGADPGSTSPSGRFGTASPAARILPVERQPQRWRGCGAAALGRRLLAGLLALGLLLAGGAPAMAMLQASPGETGTGLVRSLESLRDLDYQSWQVVAYRAGPPAAAAPITLRIVGFPGRVRMDHPTPLLVRAGLRLWELADITLANPKLAADPRAAAAEFDLTPLLADLRKDRPLRLELPGVFVELPVPPYVVAEWRRLPLEALG